VHFLHFVNFAATFEAAKALQGTRGPAPLGGEIGLQRLVPGKAETAGDGVVSKLISARPAQSDCTAGSGDRLRGRQLFDEAVLARRRPAVVARLELHRSEAEARSLHPPA
jgi:hypothetical protein